MMTWFKRELPSRRDEWVARVEDEADWAAMWLAISDPPRPEHMGRGPGPDSYPAVAVVTRVSEDSGGSVPYQGYRAVIITADDIDRLTS